ncbi:MAG: hypothetical protein IPH30_13960 [Betaproteobacteria bacterium]|nr:hypothetical protein [Betaproteobacteria bacterium]
MQAIVDVRQDDREHEDGAGEEHLDAVSGGAERHRERDQRDEGGDLEGVGVGRVVAHCARDEQRHEHDDRQALRQVRGVGKEPARDRRPAQRGEERAGEEAALPPGKFGARRLPVDEDLVERIAAQGDGRDRAEPGEERRLRELLPENRAEHEHDEQGGEIADQENR